MRIRIFSVLRLSTSCLTDLLFYAVVLTEAAFKMKVSIFLKQKRKKNNLYELTDEVLKTSATATTTVTHESRLVRGPSAL